MAGDFPRCTRGAHTFAGKDTDRRPRVQGKISVFHDASSEFRPMFRHRTGNKRHLSLQFDVAVKKAFSM